MTPPTHNTAPQTEAQLQRACEDLLDVLIARGQVIDYYHRPDREAGHRERGGFPDLCIALACGPVAVELKRDSKAAKTSPAQDRWLSAWGDRGAVCRTVGQFKAALRAWGVEV